MQALSRITAPLARQGLVVLTALYGAVGGGVGFVVTAVTSGWISPWYGAAIGAYVALAQKLWQSERRNATLEAQLLPVLRFVFEPRPPYLEDKSVYSEMSTQKALKESYKAVRAGTYDQTKPLRDPDTLRELRIGIRNSGALPARGVQLVIASCEPSSQWVRLEFPLAVRGAGEGTDGSVDIPGHDGAAFFEFAWELKPYDGKADQITIRYAKPKTTERRPANLPRGVYNLTLRCTGEATPGCLASVRLGYDDKDQLTLHLSDVPALFDGR